MRKHNPYPAPQKQRQQPLEYLKTLVYTVLPHIPNHLQQLLIHALPLLPTLDHLSETRLTYALARTLHKPQMTLRRYLRELRNTPYDLYLGFRNRLAHAIQYLAPDVPIYLALDATTLKDRFVILTVALLHHNTALPVAWRVLPAYQKGSWNAIWGDGSGVVGFGGCGCGRGF